MPVQIRQLSHTYQPGSPFARQVLFGVDLAIGDGEIVGLVGPARAGKSTVAQFCCGLIRPRETGTVVVDGIDTGAKDAALKQLRTRVGMVFQYPEDQLFEPTIAQDVGFGPRQQGLPPEEVAARVEAALELVGLPAAEFGHRHVHALSGGQKRRVAIAGVLAMGCRTLVFDEPTAGLDPKGRDEILALIRRMHAGGMTLIIISNHLEELARLVQRVVVLVDGRVAADSTTRDVLANVELMRQAGLSPLQTTAALAACAAAGLPVRTDCLTVDEMCAELDRALGGAGR